MQDLKSIQKNTALDVFKLLLKRMGLGDMVTEIYEPAAKLFEPSLVIAVAFEFPMNLNDVRTNNPFMSQFKEIMESVRTSEIVKEETSRLESELSTLKLEIKALEEEIKKVTEYKIHYEMELQLRHGPKK